MLTVGVHTTLVTLVIELLQVMTTFPQTLAISHAITTITIVMTTFAVAMTSVSEAGIESKVKLPRHFYRR